LGTDSSASNPRRYRRNGRGDLRDRRHHRQIDEIATTVVAAVEEQGGSTKEIARSV
jgi:hypothetical protein